MIKKIKDREPKIHKSCFVAETSHVIGDVTLEEGVNLWFGSVLRGDTNNIIIGKNTNIQDNSVLHVDKNHPLIIEENVTVGHGAILHGCNIGSNSLIGMGSIVLDGAVIGKHTLVAAGSLVPQGKVIPDGVLCIGSPVKVIRELTEEEKTNLTQSALNYVELSKAYK
ncbi:gamma carbonic anhydrase family protein [uncultured Clostridium sp.]|uniref:gamma carbonic anhydrase family protein n=1 Tax=uncultured Clostridium sp. TaxID=59620 RepID=UPI0028E223D6|nr:gamma carbonic anhydrase family protein [uncultured Clostridium sp.]